MTLEERKQILELVKNWFRTVILPNHIKNTVKLTDPDIFDINPFLAPYLAGYLTGELTPDSVAKALLYPRVLGTSITTSFGQNMQKFISDVLKDSFGSMVAGIDIEFIDAIDGRKKYCQAKLGPNTINKDDIETIHNHFKAARNLGRTNNIAVQHGDLVVGILYGEPGQESNHYQKLRDNHGYPLYIGQEFWHRLTGDPDFYQELRVAIAEVAVEAKGSEIIKSVADTLAKTDTIKKLAGK
ncbi:MAG: restriction endonuclease [Proteobacteria bacterium ST_bin12]|nr:MAG: restriction endonuclease [Proteobacteria bacterium ST_bin12]